MTKLLSDYQTLPPVKAKVLEPEIRAAKSRIDSSNFQLNNVNQEIIQLNNNLSMVQKMLSLKERENSSKAVNQTMGGKLDLKGLRRLERKGNVCIPCSVLRLLYKGRCICTYGKVRRRD